MAAALGITTTFAQTSYDIARYGYGELNGTARYVGMGGAMGALGADISTIGTNPAGLGLFRSNWLSGTFGGLHTSQSSTFEGTTLKVGQTKASIDQLGFVYTNHLGNRAPLRFWNFGFNYTKRSNLNQLFEAGGIMPNGLSQTMQMASMINDAGPEAVVNVELVHYLTPNEVDNIYNYGLSGYPNLPNPYSGEANSPYGYPYLGVLGVRNELVVVPANRTPNVDNDTYNNTPMEMKGWSASDNHFASRQRGGVHQFDFNTSFNLSDRFYGGLTIGLYDVDFSRTSTYTETIFSGADRGSYTIYNTHATQGSGVDLKLGAIYRPIEDSPFRIGVAVHTPTWFNLTDRYETAIESHLTYSNGGHFDANESTYDMTGGETQTDYFITTPWTFDLSLGTVFGNRLAVGAEYMYADFGTSRLRYSDYSPMVYQNQYTQDLKGVHTLKLGLEALVVEGVSLRAGYNYTSPLQAPTANKYLSFNDTRTDTEFMNLEGRHTITAGLGYRSGRYFVDLAYKLDSQKARFYAFNAEALPATNVDMLRHQVLCTVGFRF